jgi:BlaI family penicillinase repressor
MINPTPAELEILNVLWNLHEATTQVVNNYLNEKRRVGYTTTLKTMQLMAEKDILGRRKEGKSHVYFPLITELNTKNNMLDRFITHTFGGSSSQLVMQLLGNKSVSQDEINEIKTFLAQLEGQNNG